MVRMGSPGPIPVNGSIRNTAEAYFDATSATYTRAWTAVTTRVGQYRATRHERPTPTSSLYISDTDKSYISSKRILHQLHRRLARTSPSPHQASIAALAITDEASPFALRSTRNSSEIPWPLAATTDENGDARPSSAVIGACEPVSEIDAGAFPAPRTVCCEHAFQRRFLGWPCRAPSVQASW